MQVQRLISARPGAARCVRHRVAPRLLGEPKCCKSFLALDMAVAVGGGVPCLRRFARAACRTTRRSTGRKSQYTAFAERRRVEAEMKGAERYLDDLATTAKLLEGATRETKPKPRASRGKKKGER